MLDAWQPCPGSRDGPHAEGAPSMAVCGMAVCGMQGYFVCETSSVNECDIYCVRYLAYELPII